MRSLCSEYVRRLDIPPQTGTTDGKIDFQCGQEPGKNPLGFEEGVRYAGSSWIGRVRNRVVMIWDIMGRAEKGVIVIDTDKEPKWTLQLRQRDDDKPGE